MNFAWCFSVMLWCKLHVISVKYFLSIQYSIKHAMPSTQRGGICTWGHISYSFGATRCVKTKCKLHKWWEKSVEKSQWISLIYILITTITYSYFFGMWPKRAQFSPYTRKKRQNDCFSTGGLDACLSLLNTIIFAEIPSQKNLSLAGINSN